MAGGLTTFATAFAPRSITYRTTPASQIPEVLGRRGHKHYRVRSDEWHESGIAGLAGEADLRIVLQRAGGGEGPAVLAVEVYLHRLRAGIAAMAAALGGIDALVFTGGGGELVRHEPRCLSTGAWHHEQGHAP